MKILLTGFMGAGKTTLLKRFINDPETPIIDDLDELIFEQYATNAESLDQYIADVGWGVFRANEAQILGEWLSSKFSLGVLSLGGGTLEHHKALVFENKLPGVLVVWLDTSFEHCLRRIRSEKHRPLALLSDEELYQLYLRRVEDYKLSDARLSQQDVDAIYTVSQLRESCNK